MHSFKLVVKWIIPVMLAFLLMTSGFAAVEDTQVRQLLVDEAGVLSSEQQASLTALLRQTYDSGVAEHAVLILQTSEGQDLALLATEIGNEQIGNDQTDNGLLTIIAVEEREYFTAVGYGLEGELTDATMGRLQREYLVPYLAEDDYYTGLEQLILAVQFELDVTESNLATPQYNDNVQGNTWLIYLAVVMVFFIFRFSNKPKKGEGRNTGEAFAAAYIAGSFFRGGRGGSGGGFGGFGGGGFGGGGAGGGF
jgi:uncharacterized protein